MNKLKIINKSLISNTDIEKTRTLPLWIAIVSFLCGVILTGLPLVIRSNETVENIFKEYPELIVAMQGAFNESSECRVVEGELTNCLEQELDISGIRVSLVKESEGAPSVSFGEKSAVVQVGVEDVGYRIQIPYSFDFSFNQMAEKEIITYELMNQFIQSTQFSNVMNGFLMIGIQCLLYMGIGVLSLYSGTKFRLGTPYKFKELFKLQAMVSLSGGVLAFILCFVIDPIVAYAPTIYLFNIIIRNLDILTKMKKVTF